MGGVGGGGREAQVGGLQRQGTKQRLQRQGTIARCAKHKLARVECRGKAAPPKSRQGGQNDYQMRIIRISESIEDENYSR